MCASNPKIGSLYTKCCCEAQLNVPNFLTSSKIVSASVDPQTVIILLQHSHCQISQLEPSWAPVDHLNYKGTAPKLTQNPGPSKLSVPLGLCDEGASLQLINRDE